MEKKEIMTYDYKTIKVKRDMEAMAADAYESLGWELVGSSISGGAIFHVNLSFKRNRKIADKQKLLKLQEKVDSTLINIEVMQRKKKAAGQIPALTMGITGALTFGGGLSMIMTLGTGALGFLLGGIGLGIIGLGIASIAWPVFKKSRKKSLSTIEPLLENEFNKLADTCEEAK